MASTGGPSSTAPIPTIEDVIHEHGPFVRRTLAQLGVPPRFVPDLAQEVFRGVHRGLHTFDPTLAPAEESALRSWLFGICERQAANHRRAEIRRGEVLVTIEEVDTARDAPTTEEELIAVERAALLHRLLDTLEPRRRAVVVAYELEGIPMTEVAAAVGIPVNTAWNRLRLAREDLRLAASRMVLAQGRASACSAQKATAAALPSGDSSGSSTSHGAGGPP